MPLIPSPDPKSSMWAWIAHDLRVYRLRAKLTGEEFGKIIKVAKSSVSKLEQGSMRLDPKQAVLLDTALKTGGHFDRLVTYALREQGEQWFQDHKDIESTARTIKVYDGVVVPGLLQTPEYARALVEAGGWAAEEAEATVEDRMKRQEVLTRRKPPLLLAIMAETVLDWPVGGSQTMLRQLESLLEAGEAPHVGIRVVPTSVGAHIGLDGSFKVLVNELGEVAYTESPGRGQLIYSQEARPYIDRYDRVGLKALSEDQSRELVRQKMKEYERD